MTLAESLLPKLSDWVPAGAGRHSLSVALPDEAWTVHLAADKAETLSCLVWELALERTAPAAAGLTLEAWANAIAHRVSGLMEPLAVYEVDQTRDEAILRSAKPSAKGDDLAYYELRLSGLARAALRRFTATRNSGGRSQTTFALTHEAITKLAGDIAG